MRTALAALVLLSACGSKVYSVDQKLTPQVDAFYAEGATRGVVLEQDNLIVEVGETKSGESGRCETNPFGSPHVILNADFVKAHNAFEVEELVFHELGHCLLDRHHTTTVDADGAPTSVMSPTVFNGFTYRDHRAAYLDELFGVSK